MQGFNRVFIIGYLGRPPELLTTKEGKPFAKMSVACHRARRGNDGQWETQTEWHRVTAWGKTAEQCAGFLDTGSPLAVEGHLSQYRPEVESGKPPVILTSIIADHVHFLPRGNKPSEREIPSGEEMAASP
jgi:single-strand DNA-binding protein